MRLEGWRQRQCPLSPDQATHDTVPALWSDMQRAIRLPSHPLPPRRLLRPLLLLGAAMGLAASLAGCGVVAAPLRVTSGVVKVVPVAGDVVAAPLDVTADTID